MFFYTRPGPLSVWPDWRPWNWAKKNKKIHKWPIVTNWIQCWVTNWCHRITLMADTQRSHYRSNVTSLSVTQRLTLTLTHYDPISLQHAHTHTHQNYWGTENLLIRSWQENLVKCDDVNAEDTDTPLTHFHLLNSHVLSIFPIIWVSYGTHLFLCYKPHITTWEHFNSADLLHPGGFNAQLMSITVKLM